MSNGPVVFGVRFQEIGLPLGQQFTIAEDYRYSALQDMALDTTLERAQSNRQDLQASVAALRAAEDALKAAHAERLPNLTVAADYGVAGLRPTTDADSVWTVSGTLTIPIWEGGRIRGDIDQATAVFRQRQAELEDLRGQVDQDVRQAFIDLNSAADQVEKAISIWRIKLWNNPATASARVSRIR
jgi:outer membrane protein TolC